MKNIYFIFKIDAVKENMSLLQILLEICTVLFAIKIFYFESVFYKINQINVEIYSLLTKSILIIKDIYYRPSDKYYPMLYIGIIFNRVLNNED